MIIKIIFVFVIGLFLLSASTELMAQRPGGPAQPTPVIVSVVERESFSDKVEALGTLRANESVNLTSTVTEKVTGINFEDNETVQAGTLLIEMDAAEEYAELSEQQSFLAEAQKQLDRVSPLVEQGNASEARLDEQQREIEVIRARLEAIQSRIDQRMIKAPFDGVLGLREISVGTLAQPGTVLTTIDDLSVMKLDFSVPEVFLANLEPGLSIEAQSEAFPDRVFAGQISSVDSRIDPVTRAITARAVLENRDGLLKPGMLMKIELQKNTRDTLLVPEESLIADGGRSFVLVVTEQDGAMTAERREVSLGARQFGNAEILSGVTAGDRVITHGTLRVRPGSPVKIQAVERNDETLKELLEQSGDGASE